MTTQPILINDQWSVRPAEDSFGPENPSTGEPLGETYPVSGLSTLLAMAEHARQAAEDLNHCPPDQIGAFLETHADLIDKRRDEIAQMAHLETGLPFQPRLREVEMDRTIDQLRQAAECVRSRDWMSARIDTKLDLRSMYEPLGGAVLTIGPNNFPLAYNGIAGGDFAAAIAARNPIIAKAHPLHPGTTRLLAQCAHDAAAHADLPSGSVQMFYHCKPDDGLELIKSQHVGAVGFTGSQLVGLELKRAADETGTPIYLELSSINPMFLLPGALDARCDEMAEMISESLLAASGQQCTCPGLIVVPERPAGVRFIQQLAERLGDAEPQVMLSAGGVKGLHESVQHVIKHGAELLIGGRPVSDTHARYEHTLLHVDAARFLEQPESLQHEMFGVAALVVVCEEQEQMVQIARSLSGNLTGTIHSDQNAPEDRQLADRITGVLRPRVGRLIHDAVPTGVSVNASTVHGGPFPATGHPGFTAVGLPTSIHRFAALRCYDRVPERSLPPELRNTNPTGTMMRFINGTWTNKDAQDS
ncbi:MAG: ketoglutarate semialdehyde dehydrogenase [Phycisphaerae bacterium]|nr:ketoglutarate semialdehyde dehydrogenase [Phycisphaerae bacterium]MBM91448.1 ketoglutarate semialdehyde dehydrogenase [Phycisphaerae bacterium]MBM92685.1 ketoglutarate semialdehyde dehydrogenase [Phycisphaerae bacterium]